MCECKRRTLPLLRGRKYHHCSCLFSCLYNHPNLPLALCKQGFHAGLGIPPPPRNIEKLVVRPNLQKGMPQIPHFANAGFRLGGGLFSLQGTKQLAPCRQSNLPLVLYKGQRIHPNLPLVLSTRDKGSIPTCSAPSKPQKMFRHTFKSIPYVHSC